jgi:hypothetical protein
MTADTTNTPPDAERLPWVAPAITAIDLAGETETGTYAYSSESSYPNDQRYAS